MIGFSRTPRRREKVVRALTLAGPDVIGAGFALPRVPTRGPAFPCGRRHLDRWGSRAGLHFRSNWPEVNVPWPVAP